MPGSTYAQASTGVTSKMANARTDGSNPLRIFIDSEAVVPFVVARGPSQYPVLSATDLEQFTLAEYQDARNGLVPILYAGNETVSGESDTVNPWFNLPRRGSGPSIC